jgi:hypothetical protein
MKMRKMLITTLVTVCVALLASLPSQSLAIGGGSPDGNGHPNVAFIGFDLDGPGGDLPPWALCTCFVASDSVLITAAHCIEFAPNASWAVTLQPGSPSDPVYTPGLFPDDFPFPIIVPVTYAEQVIMHPHYGEGLFRANDVGVLLFPEGTFASVTPVTLPSEVQLDALAAHGGLLGQDFTLVGYGGIPFDRPRSPGCIVAHEPVYEPGYRQVASAPFQALMPESLILQATAEATHAGYPAPGDSGGPQLLGDSNLAVSLVGGIANQGEPCGTGALFFQRLDTPVIREFLGEYVALP